MLNHGDEMSLQERVSDLEKKVLEQTDEITCLRSTIADLARRMNQLEGRGETVRSLRSADKVRRRQRTRRPVGTAKTARAASCSTRAELQRGCRSCRKTTFFALTQFRRLAAGDTVSRGHGGRGIMQPFGCPSNEHYLIPRAARSAPPCPHLKSVSYTVSPTTQNRNCGSKFGFFPPENRRSRTDRRIVSGSLYNLPMRSASGTLLRHGTKDAQLNSEEGTVRMFLRGRPIVMHIPSDQLHDYSLTKVNSAPHQRLKLEWVYGYRGRDCRANLFLLPTGEMVYFIAAVVVLYNVEDQIQRHYLGHSDDIKCLAVHPNKLLIATGQVASIDRRDRKPHVRIWDSVSLNTLHVIGVGDFERAVSCIAFSKMDGGSILCAVDDSSEHTISLWDWQRGERGSKITETKSASDAVLAVEFHPMDRHVLVTLGKGHIHFWDMEGGTLAKKLGIFEVR
ncbi:unnamed protein product [Ixodes pacificus]